MWFFKGKNDKKIKQIKENDLLNQIKPIGVNGKIAFTIPTFEYVNVSANKVSGELSNGEITYKMDSREKKEINLEINNDKLIWIR
ncbi:MAG: hypothetical protein HRT99_03615 [Mycoplasmatales bacterium]|nr:hypothetical protein [Mycoplasmatales bacterium]